MIRTEATLTVSRFTELIGIPPRTYHLRLAKWRVGDPVKGPWPVSVVDRIEPTVAKYAEWYAWGHRKISVDRPSRRPRCRVAVVGETSDGSSGSAATVGVSDGTTPAGPDTARGVP